MSMTGRIPPRLAFLVALCLGLTAATGQTVKTPLPTGDMVSDKTASSGKLLKIDLEKAKPGPVATIKLTGKPAGKYVATLRLKLSPVDSYSESFMLSAGNDSRAFMGTTNPDPTNSDYRLWVLPFVYDGKGELALKVVMNRQGGAEDKHARGMLLDHLDVKTIGRSYIESIRPNKVCYDPGDEISCAVTLHEPKAAMTVRAIESFGLAESREVATAKVGRDGKLTLKWNAGKDEYGRAVRVELLSAGKIIDEASDVYNVTDNVWKVAMAANVQGMHMSDPRSIYCSAKTDEQLAENINVGTRATYGNFKEAFASAAG